MSSIMDGFMKQEVNICKKLSRNFNGKITYGESIASKAKVKKSKKLKRTSTGEEVLINLEVSLPITTDVDIQDKIIYEGDECFVVVKDNKYGLDGKLMYLKIYTSKQVNY